MGRVIGVMGGTFDPPHLGHLILAESALEALDLERVLWVLTPRSPLKADAEEPAPVEVRERMVEAAIAGQPRFRLSRVDLERPGPHYAADTLEIVRRDDPQSEFAFLIGSDSLADLPRWHEPERLARLCTAFGVVERPGYPVELASLEGRIPGISGRVRPIAAPPVGISASEIRRRVRHGRSIRYLVPDGVREVIERGRIYAAMARP